MSAKLRVKTIPTVQDPFWNDSIATMPAWWMYGVQVLVGFTLFPIRLVVLLFIVLPLTLISLIPFSSCFDSKNSHGQPHGCCRSCWVYPLRALNRLLLWCFGFWWISIDRKKFHNATPSVIVANHTALMDAMFMVWFYAPMAVAKLGVKHIPIAGGLAIAVQTIFVDRKNAEAKQKVLQDIKERTAEGTKFPPLLIFPEGTCTNGKVLVQFKKGPFTAQRPVQPVILKYGSTYLELCACGDNDRVGMAVAFLLMMLQPFNTLKATLMPEYKPTTEEKEDAILFANNVRTIMAKEMNVGTTNHSYEDVFFSAHMKKRNKQDVGQQFVVKDMMKAFALSYDDIIKMMDDFARATGKDTTMHFQEFCQHLNLKDDTAEALAIWHFFDNDDDGTVEFSEFVRGVALLSHNVDDVDRLRLAFALLDHEKQGKVSIVDIRKFLADADRLEVVKGYMENTIQGTANAQDTGAVAVVIAEATTPGRAESKTDAVEGSVVAPETEKEEDNENEKNEVWKSRNNSPASVGNTCNNPGMVRQSSLLDCFASIDEDGDGLVTFDEFVTLAHRRGTLAGPLLQVARNLLIQEEGDGMEEEEEPRLLDTCKKNDEEN